MKKIISGLVTILGLSDLYAAIPALSSVSISNGTVRISGANFGAKSVAAPLKFQPFTATSSGQTFSQVGFDFVAGNNSGSARNRTDMADGVGGGSWLHVTPGGGAESFSHFGHLLPEKTNAVYASYWVRIRRMTPATSGSMGQFKAMRSGMRTGLDPIDNMYYRNPKFEFSCYMDVTNTASLTGANAGATNTNGNVQIYYPEGLYNTPLISDTWQFCEVYYRLNTVGQADGIQQIRWNGTQQVDLRDRKPRTLGSEYLGYMQYNPGLANGFARSVWEARFSRIYLDTTRARVFLGNAATLTACTRRVLLAPTAWSNNSITLGSVATVPAGFNWVYVSNRDGEINALGYSLAGSIGLLSGANLAGPTGLLPGATICRSCKSEGILADVYNARGQVLPNHEARRNAKVLLFPEAFRHK